MREKMEKFLNVTKRDGFIVSIKKSLMYISVNYFSKINIIKKLGFKLKQEKISNQIDDILNNESYDRIIVWRSSFGWNVPLYQRPQQIARCLINEKCLVFYEVTRMTDKVNYIKKEKENLYLVNYEIDEFSELLFKKLTDKNIPKYLQLYSTSWNIKFEEVSHYTNNGFKMLYEYIDDLSPLLAGTDKLPKNVIDIHNYVSENTDVLVVTSADLLYKDIITKRKSEKNVILSTNGVDVNHFDNLENKEISKLEKIKKEYSTLIGYYGALASWFDYDTVKELATKHPEWAFLLIGVKYDTTFDDANLNEFSNIFYLGAIPYQELPYYANYFDIAWIPFLINDITLATSPLKLFEYMALKKYIITSAMPECKKYKSVNIAKSVTDYENLILSFQKNMTKKYKDLLIKESLENSWDFKSKEIIELLKNNEKWSELMYEKKNK